VAEAGVEDLKIGVTEVCSGAITGAPDGVSDPLQLEVWLHDGHVRLQLRSTGAIDLGRIGDEEVSRLDLLLALFADVRFEREPSGEAVVGLSVPVRSGGSGGPGGP